MDFSYSPDEERFRTELRAWLEAHPCAGYQLVVAHTHAHGDHVAGDARETIEVQNAAHSRLDSLKLTYVMSPRIT